MDLLEQAIAAAKELMKARYVLHIQRGTESKTLNLRFYKRSFYHLFGFHKIKEIESLFLQKRKNASFQAISKNRKLLQVIVASPIFDQIEGRMVCVCLFDEMLKTDETMVFRNAGKAQTFKTLIPFDILLKSTFGEYHFYSFWKTDNDIDFRPVSLFIDDSRLYEENQQAWKLAKVSSE